MAPPGFWESITELSAIAVKAAEVGSPLRLRGSLARELRRADKEDRLDSLFDYVPALADIDLITQSESAADDFHEAIYRELGDSRFFHWEVKTEREVARHKGLANVEVVDEPEVLFTSSSSTADPNPGTFLRVHFEAENKKVHFIERNVAEPERARFLADNRLIQPEFALADLLYLLRRFPRNSEDSVTLNLADYLKRQGGKSISRMIEGASLRSTVFCYLKYLVNDFAFGPSDTAGVLLRRLGSDFVHDFVSVRDENDPLPQMMRIDLLRAKERPHGLVCTIVPRLESGGRTRRWIRRVESVSAAFSEPFESAQQLDFDPQLMPEFDAKPERAFSGITVIGPPAEIETDDPPEPGCCRFKDFDRGVAEILWAGPDAGSAIHPRLGLAAEGEFSNQRASFLSYGYVGRRPITSFRCDYGFLCIGAGSKRLLSLYRIADDHAN